MLLWTWGCRSLFYTPHPIHFSLSPLLLSWSRFPFSASFYISLPPVLSLAMNFLTQFQFCFIPKEYMYIVLRFGIKNWCLLLDHLLQVSHSQFIFMMGHQKTYWIRGESLLTVGWSDTPVSVLRCGCGDFSCGLWTLEHTGSVADQGPPAKLWAEGRWGQGWTGWASQACILKKEMTQLLPVSQARVQVASSNQRWFNGDSDSKSPDAALPSSAK